MSPWGRRRRRDQPVPDRPWNDPALDAALDAVPGMLPEPALDRALAHLRPLRSDIERHVQATQALGAALTGKLDAVRGQAGRFATDDPATEADLLALLGVSLAAFAWEVRGDGPGAEVGTGTARRFLAGLEEADLLLQEALRLSPYHPAAATARLSTARGLGADEEQWWQRFSDCRRISGTLYPAHLSMMTGLCRKWYGSDEQMFDFARTVAVSVPIGDPVVAVLPAAHAEYLVSLRMFPPARGSASPDRRWAESYQDGLEAVVDASTRWCGDGVPPAPHARDVEAHHWFGWYLGRSRDHLDRARWHLEQADTGGVFRSDAGLPLSVTKAFATTRSRLRVR